MKINHFVIDNTAKELTVEFFEDISKNDTKLSFEFLRVCSDSHQAKNKNRKPQLVSHKKNILLNTIECVAKHGYRLIFDDGYSVVLSDDSFRCLIIERQQRWQDYLDELQASGHSREAMIEIKQL